MIQHVSTHKFFGMKRKLPDIVPDILPSEDEENSSDYDSDEGSSGSEPEVTLNILERQPRITAGTSKLTRIVHF